VRFVKKRNGNTQLVISYIGWDILVEAERSRLMWVDGYWHGEMKDGYPICYFDENGNFRYPWEKDLKDPVCEKEKEDADR
jgi:hypothetical protein